MAQDKNDTPTVASYEDHEVITPPNRLQKAVAMTKPAGFDPVARAEEALGNLSSEFSGWMNQECERLDKARREVKEKGFSKATRQSLFHAAPPGRGPRSAVRANPLRPTVPVTLCHLVTPSPCHSVIFSPTFPP